jgi:hypothetical protein
MNKKTKFFLLLPFLFFYLTVLSQHLEGITGVWLKQSTEGKIEIFKVYDMLFGNLIWLKNPINESEKLKLVTKNPDAPKPIENSKVYQDLLVLDGTKPINIGMMEKSMTPNLERLTNALSPCKTKMNCISGAILETVYWVEPILGHG